MSGPRERFPRGPLIRIRGIDSDEVDTLKPVAAGQIRAHLIALAGGSALLVEDVSTQLLYADIPTSDEDSLVDYLYRIAPTSSFLSASTKCYSPPLRRDHLSPPRARKSLHLLVRIRNGELPVWARSVVSCFSVAGIWSNIPIRSVVGQRATWVNHVPNILSPSRSDSWHSIIVRERLREFVPFHRGGAVGGIGGEFVSASDVDLVFRVRAAEVDIQIYSGDFTAGLNDVRATSDVIFAPLALLRDNPRWASSFGTNQIVVVSPTSSIGVRNKLAIGRARPIDLGRVRDDCESVAQDVRPPDCFSYLIEWSAKAN
jgi:hypothetical protein